ncbi:MAG: tyrosine-type recombinase/integrase [Chitinophagaceae bacterium]|nr:tyrosine-type recombinase/integrase [Chitinophagaceae bacterium]
MRKVILKPLLHKGAEWIGIYFELSHALNGILRKQMAANWSVSNKCWYVPLNQSSFEKIHQLLVSKAEIEDLAVLERLKSNQPIISKPESQENANQEGPSSTRYIISSGHSGTAPFKRQTEKKVPVVAKVYAINADVLPRMEQELILRGYSPSTRKTYLNEMQVFLGAIRDHAANEFTVQRLRDYLQYCLEKLKLSENTLHSRINALKFYYEKVLKQERFFWEIPRPKKQLLLPKLLNEEELARLFNAMENRKHKAMLFTAYSAGLRVSEIVNLKIADIDGQRMQIMVSQAKGKKDRYVNLSPVLLDILREYMKQVKPKPLVYLFESEQTRQAYPVRTVQQIFSNAKNKAGIQKEVGIHSLRHSFATHLLDKGTDIRYIKELLGHFNIRTTERYLHVSKKQLVNIVSPFDDLWKKTNLDW